MALECSIMFQPPERRPDEDHGPGALTSEPFQLGYGRRVVGRWSPILSVAFEKRQSLAMRQRTAKVFLVDEDELVRRAHEPQDLVPGLAQTPGLIGERLAWRSAFERRHSWLGQHGQQGRSVHRVHQGAGESMEILLTPETAMPLEFVAAKILLLGLELRRGHDHRFFRSRKSILQQSPSGVLLQVLEDI